MLTLDNFEDSVSREIVQRGQQYFLNKSILSLEETNDNEWEAEVEGSEIYTVTVHLSGREITQYTCNCPYDGGITCKHAVSVFFALRKNFKKIQEGKQKSPKVKKITLDELLAKISYEELKKFVLDYSALHKDFARDIEIHFAEKDHRIDLRKHYTDIIHKVIRKNSDHGFIDYRNSFAVAKAIDLLIAEANALTRKGKFAEAMLIGQLVLSEMIEVIGDSDDSSGELGGSISSATELLNDMTESEEVSFALKTNLFHWLTGEISKKAYYDYGDYGLEIVDVAQNIALQIGEGESFMKSLDNALLQFSGYSFEFYSKIFLERKIDVLEKLGRAQEIRQLISQNLEVPEMRQKVVDEKIAQKDYKQAKLLINEGIKIAEAKSYAGVVTNWEKKLLEIAKLENNLNDIRFYTKKFAFDSSRLNPDYYHLWKNTFSKQEWAAELKALIDGVHKEVAQKSKKEKSIWFKPEEFVFNSLAPLFIIEGMWDKLLEITQKNVSLDTLDKVYEYLAKRHPQEIFELYMPFLRKKSQIVSDRSDYKELANYLIKLKKDIAGSEPVINSFVAELKAQNIRKPAMLDELSKVR